MFGLIMALSFTLTFAVATADNMAVRTMLLAALGCNLAWGIIDGGVYLLARLNQQGRAVLRWRAARDAPDAGTAQRVIADAMPSLLASVVKPAQLETMRQKLRITARACTPAADQERLARRAGNFLLSFLSTFPIVIPFLFIGDARLALRVSNVVAITMLFLCGFMFGRYAGFRPMAMGAAMVALGGALVGVAIALGG